MAEQLTIWVLGDGKPGHENQALGLAEAIARLRSCAIQTIALGDYRGWISRIRAATRAAAAMAAPDLLVAAGHATHLPLLWLARKFQVPSIVLMRPSLPICWFDLCIAPAHDFTEPPSASHVLTTRGALNRVAATATTRRQGGLILIGGPSATHAWDPDSLLDALVHICTGAADGTWTLTDSRRTPAEFSGLLRQRLPNVRVFPHAETTRDWLPSCLASAAEVWVTEDSVSMVYEALSSGAAVGLLPVPGKVRETRVLRGLAGLVSDGFVTPYAHWLKSRTLAPPPYPLREADRCAAEILTRFPKLAQPA